MRVGAHVLIAHCVAIAILDRVVPVGPVKYVQKKPEKKPSRGK